MFTLPVSRLEVALRPPCGADDLALVEGPREALPAAIATLSRLAARADGAAQDWAQLTVTDFECLLLKLRGFLLGDEVSSQAACGSCGERVELSFGITAYAAQVRPRSVAGVAAAREGWLALETAEFRLPVVADVLAAKAARDPGEMLRRRCLAPRLEGRLQRRIERVMERLAPQASGEVGGACPGCGASLTSWFDIPGFVIAELRRLAAGLYREVHLLASHYHWAEAAILALPGARRRAYAGLILDARLGAD